MALFRPFLFKEIVMNIHFNQHWIYTDTHGNDTMVTLPHDAMIISPRHKNAASGVNSGFFSGGIYTYRKEFIIDAEYVDKHIELLFEGAYRCVSIYLNGEMIGYKHNGFFEFTVNLTGKVIEGKNLIKVVCDNTLQPNCRWYTGGGLFRPVTLIVKEKEHIRDVKIVTLSYEKGLINIDAITDSNEPIQVEIFDKETRVFVGELGNIIIPNCVLWDAHNPHLYHCVLSTTKDQVKVVFGVREITIDSTRGFAVNGQSVLLKGACIHHDNGVLGACSYKDAEYRRVRILKEQGFNALRMAHNPASRFLLEACDYYGMYVIDEAYDGWYIPKTYHDHSRHFFETYKEDLASMVKKDRNHPSVIMYSIGNEVSETAEVKGIDLAQEMHALIQSMDDTRFTTVGINVLLNVYYQLGIGVYKDKHAYKETPLKEDKAYKEKKSGSAFFNALTNKLGGLFFFMSKGKRAERICQKIAPTVDILGLNYASSRYDQDARKYPERLMIGSETMVGDLPYNWERVKKYPQLLGDFVWAGWDYIGEACIGDWTYHSYVGLPLLAGQGMIDITGLPLASMAYMQVVWGERKTPFICVRPVNHAHETPSTGAWQFTNALASYAWNGHEGQKAVVEVFADAYKVRLLLNNRQIGEKKINDFKTMFKLNYQRGKLVAIAMDEQNKEISRSELSSNGNQVLLSLNIDKEQIQNEELSFVEIEFRDEHGLVIPTIEQRVTVDIQGESIRLLGLGSALCKTDEIFNTPNHDTYRGRALAVFASTGIKGKSRVVVSSKGVESKAVVLEVI